MDGSVNEQGALPMRQILWLCDKPLLDHLATPRPLRTPCETFHHRGAEGAKGGNGFGFGVGVMASASEPTARRTADGPLTANGEQ